MISAKGHTGTVEFDGRTVTIKRDGLLARRAMGRGEKQIPLASIAAVQWKPANLAYNGFIEFTVPGGVEKQSRRGQATKDALRNENAVVFMRHQMPAFEALRQAINAARNTPPTPQNDGNGDLPTKLRELAELHAQDVLSDTEFEAAKRRLIG